MSKITIEQLEEYNKKVNQFVIENNIRIVVPKPCPFCGCMPNMCNGVVTHVSPSDNICIVDDTQYDLEKWNQRV